MIEGVEWRDGRREYAIHKSGGEVKYLEVDKLADEEKGRITGRERRSKLAECAAE